MTEHSTFVYEPPERPGEDLALAHDLVTRLNALLEDPLVCALIETMIENRVVVSEDLAEHPTVQCARDSDDHPLTAGLLGLLNGVVGVDSDGWGHVAACVDDKTGQLREFIVRNKQDNPVTAGK